MIKTALTNGEQSSNQLFGIVGGSKTTYTESVKDMVYSGEVSKRKEGKNVFYSLIGIGI